MRIKKSTNTFRFRKAKGEDAPAIWFRLHGRDVKVYPLALYDALWNELIDDFICKGVKATISNFTNDVYGVFFDYTYGYYQVEYQSTTFVESATHSLTKLCNAVLRDEQVSYTHFDKRTAEQMLIGLQELVSYNHSDSHSKNVERFIFEFVEPYACDTKYFIQIGNKKYQSALSDWSKDFNQIRLDIESAIIWTRSKADIKLHFEDSPTIIHLQFCSGDKVSVTIVPNSFQDLPKVYGHCDTRQLISALYLGLLKICITESDWFSDGYWGDWNEARLAIYNKLQSCVIENYIKGITEEEFTYLPRQRVINTVDEMKADYQRLQEELAM